MSIRAKKRLSVCAVTAFVLLLCVAAVLVLYGLSPAYPGNISDKTVAEKGAEYTIKLKGISEYDEKGFDISTDGFYFTGNNAFVHRDEEGYAFTTYDGEGEALIKGKYNSEYIAYDNYEFCGESYKNRRDMETFFEIADPIYNFDINKLPVYVSDIINYEKQFVGKAKVRIYRGRCVITEIYIGDEKVLVLK